MIVIGWLATIPTAYQSGTHVLSSIGVGLLATADSWLGCILPSSCMLVFVLGATAVVDDAAGGPAASAAAATRASRKAR